MSEIPQEESRCYRYPDVACVFCRYAFLLCRVVVVASFRLCAEAVQFNMALGELDGISSVWKESRDDVTMFWWCNNSNLIVFAGGSETG